MYYKIKLKRPDQKKSALFVEFMKNGTSFKFYTGKTIQTKNWSSSKQQVLSGEQNHLLINAFLEEWLKNLSHIIAEMEVKKERLTKDSIQSKLKIIFKKDANATSSQGDVNDFISYMELYISGKRDKKRNLQRLNQCKKHVIIAFRLISKNNLVKWNKLGSKQKSLTDLKADQKLHFEDINLKFLEKFREYFLNATFTVRINKIDVTKNYKINYRDKQIKTLKQFLEQAIEEGYVKRFSWKSIKSEKKDADSVFTDFMEIQQLYDEHLTKPTEILVRDKYVLNCFLGMRYSDLNKLEKHFFQKRNISGKEFIIYCGRQVKTDNRIEFALHPIAQEILDRYDYNMPKLSAKEYNDVLKIVAHKAGLRRLERIREIRGTEHIERDIPKYELMSSHAGRRSFCTNFYNEGVSMAAIMSISGHKTESEFRKYIKKNSVRLDVVAEQVFAIQGLNIRAKIS